MSHRSIGSSIVAFCLVALLIAATNAQRTRIVNGVTIDISQAPYIVQLRDAYGRQFCAGTLVTPLHVVTAAHCFDNNPYTAVTVVGGATKVTEMGVQRRIVGFIKPLSYTSQNMQNDVAILKLESPMQGANIVTVRLCSNPMMAAQKLQVSGWGRTVDGGATSEVLRTTFLPLISGTECQARHANTGIMITPAMICALSPSGTDACHGDSGGPGIFNGELCGIVSWGLKCASGTPSVYTNVFGLRAYIESAIQSL